MDRIDEYIEALKNGKYLFIEGDVEEEGFLGPVTVHCEWYIAKSGDSYHAYNDENGASESKDEDYVRKSLEVWDKVQIVSEDEVPDKVIQTIQTLDSEKERNPDHTS